MLYTGAVVIQRSDGEMCLIRSFTAQEGRVRLMRLATGAVRTAKTDDIVRLRPEQFSEQFHHHMIELVSPQISGSKIAEAKEPAPKSTPELIKRYLEIIMRHPSRTHEVCFVQELIIMSVWRYEIGLPMTSRVIMINKIWNIFSYLDLNFPSKSLIYSRFASLNRSLMSDAREALKQHGA